MAGTVKADVIQSDQSTPTVFRNTSGTEIGQFCKSWVNYNAITPTVRANFNVSSVTKNATGDYSVNFTNAHTDANYGITHIGGVRSESWGVHLRNNSVVPTTSAYRFWSVTPADSPTDPSLISVAFFR